MDVNEEVATLPESSGKKCKDVSGSKVVKQEDEKVWREESIRLVKKIIKELYLFCQLQF